MGDRRTSFDRRAALYDEVRPSYPQEVVATVRARVPGGRAARWLAVIRNDKAPMERADLDAVYAKHFGRAKGETPHDHAAEVTAAVGACEEHAFPWSARYTTARYLALLDTYSDNIVLPD